MYAKTSFYGYDGSGRDSYIGINSGGLRYCEEPLKYTRPQANMRNNKALCYDLKSVGLGNLKIKHHATRYYGDGTGRDVYIGTDYGGTLKGRLGDQDVMKEFMLSRSLADKNAMKCMQVSFSTPKLIRKPIKVDH
jgi:hypothetical protein